MLRDRRKGSISGTWSFLSCDSCGVYYIETIPEPQTISSWYETYHTSTLPFGGSRGGRHPNLAKVARWLRGDVDPRDTLHALPGQRVLDFGCGQAPYLVDIRLKGVDVVGADVAPTIAKAYQQAGYDVRLVTNLGRIPFADAEFDAAYLMQVLEHVPNPHLLMRELSRVIKPRGTLILAVPNVKSVWRAVFGHNWISGWFAPLHLVHYTEEAVCMLADASGFEVIRITSRTPESWIRLNLKAFLYPQSNNIETLKSVLDFALVRYGLMAFLLVTALFTKQQDCLFIELQRR